MSRSVPDEAPAHFLGEPYRFSSCHGHVLSLIHILYVIDASDDEFGGADNYLLIATDGSYPFTGVIPYGD